LGEVRESELGDSLDILDIGRDNGVVINEPCVSKLSRDSLILMVTRNRELKDNMSIYWNADIVLTYMKPFIKKHGVKSVSLH
jgi:hypothetical protein